MPEDSEVKDMNLVCLYFALNELKNCPLQDPETERKLAAAEEKKRIQETRERVDPQVCVGVVGWCVL